MENEAEKDLQCQAPVRLDLPPEKPLTSSLAKQEGWNNSELTSLNEEAEIILRVVARESGFLVFKLYFKSCLIEFFFKFSFFYHCIRALNSL